MPEATSLGHTLRKVAGPSRLVSPTFPPLPSHSPKDWATRHPTVPQSSLPSSSSPALPRAAGGSPCCVPGTMFEFNDDSHLGRPASAPSVSRDRGPRWQHHSPDPDISRPVGPSSGSSQVLTDSTPGTEGQGERGTFHEGLLAGC